MAFLFTHEWMAKLILSRLKKKSIISNYDNIDDYFFGAIAPDIRYINSTDRNITHEVEGKQSIFEISNADKYSKAFLAGFETHLIVDDVWSNDKNWSDKSIYEFYNVDANNIAQKFALYLLIDDYFQGEADWFFAFESAGNIFRSNDTCLLVDLGFNHTDILLYKSMAAIYLREPGIDTFKIINFIPGNLDEIFMKTILEQKSTLTSYLKEFKKISIDKCLESLEKHL
ncbi:MAG: zinc dependent phospholipase C family protein [Candidatus Diapherotrites archaeon]